MFHVQEDKTAATTYIFSANCLLCEIAARKIHRKLATVAKMTRFPVFVVDAFSAEPFGKAVKNVDMFFYLRQSRHVIER